MDEFRGLEKSVIIVLFSTIIQSTNSYHRKLITKEANS